MRSEAVVQCVPARHVRISADGSFNGEEDDGKAVVIGAIAGILEQILNSVCES